MRVSVISPVKHSGSTMATILAAHAIAKTQDMRVMLTYTGQNRRICEYLNVNGISDKTRSINQISKLLQSNAINDSDIYDYTIPVSSNLDIMDTADSSLSEEESANLMTYVFEHIPSDAVFCDVGTEVYSEVTQKLFKNSDLVLIVIQADKHGFDALAEWKKSEYWPKGDVVIVVNRYDERIAALREISKEINYPHRSVCKIHYNPYITKFSNKSEAHNLMKLIVDKDVNVIELNNDFKEITQAVLSHSTHKFKWEV